jgi:predicted TIM-barrel fold metal-dependent hydrolase
LSVFEEPKIDGHCHILDPVRFPYPSDVAYKPQGQEMGDADYFLHLMQTYCVEHALLVGPNSGYSLDNRCMLSAIAQAPQRFKGIAVVKNDCSMQELSALQQQGVIGIAFNVALNSVAFYRDIEPLLKRLQTCGMFAQFQVEGNQLSEILGMIRRTQVKVLIDHCGRPVLSQGLHQSGFLDLLELGRERQAVVKISGFAKFSQVGYPFDDVQPYIDALITAFGFQQCIWASDWPYLKAPYRLDYGPMLKWMERAFTQPERQQLFWDTPKEVFGF